MRGDPYTMLTRFEAKHGSYHDLLAQRRFNGDKEDKRIERLMAWHNQLVWCWMGYMHG